MVSKMRKSDFCLANLRKCREFEWTRGEFLQIYDLKKRCTKPTINNNRLSQGNVLKIKL